MNVYLGTYERVDGSIVKGPSLSDLVAAKDKAVDADMKAKLEAAEAAAAAMVNRAESVEAYDQMIGEGNAEGNAVVEKVVQALTIQTRSIERAVATLDLSPIEFEGSDSLDNQPASSQSFTRRAAGARRATHRAPP